MQHRATKKFLSTLDPNLDVEVFGKRINPRALYVTANDVEYFPVGIVKVADVAQTISELRSGDSRFRRPGIVWYVTPIDQKS